MSPRLRTEIFVNAYMRRARAQGAFATVLRKGDPDAGIIIIRLIGRTNTVRVLMESRNIDGARVWRDLSGGGTPEAEADALVERQARFDSDLWVVDVEDREGRSFLDEPVVD